MRTYIVSLPWEERGAARFLKLERDSKTGEYVYKGDYLPDHLKDYASEDYSWERWLEDDLNGRILSPSPATYRMKPHEHQLIAAKRIVASAKHGFPGFVEADLTGLGKTLSSTLGAYGVAKLKGFTPEKPAKVLIVCPKSVIPGWRETIAASGVNNMRVAVINYDRLRKLIKAPASVAKAKKTSTKNKQIATKGTSLIDWDIIIADESHKVKNMTSQRSAALETICRWDKPNPPFVIWSSATIGQNPVELGYMAPLLGHLTSPKKPVKLTPTLWGKWLETNGFAVSHGKNGYSWIKESPWKNAEEVEKAQKQDLTRIRNLLFTSAAPTIRRHPEDIAGWPKNQIISNPVTLDMKNMKLYRELWSQFRSFLRLNRKGKDPKGALAQQLRFRQKASLLRIDETADFALDLLENGFQVAISVQFMETIDGLKEKLEKNGYPCVEFSGRVQDREKNRVAFQKGQAKVILFTVTEGISLHAEEMLKDGTRATSAERATIIHDNRWSALENFQICGRAHRDGKRSIVYLMYAKNTVEEKLTKAMIKRLAGMKDMSGDDLASVREIENLLNEAADEED